uniref:uncharacterized protein LOC118532602 isoform X1 n=1 Tax=Halichoerus grypus TaxID=9711 RepID=UPI0016595046|nr:uncharacterized protein LOC118532602 isoform X1 [Halichoerus grypus]
MSRGGTLKAHDCVLIYKSGTEGDENHTPDSNFIGLTTKMLKVKRLEEINTCYNSNKLEEMAFFQCMEKVEKVKCFLEESSSEQESRSGKNEGKHLHFPCGANTYLFQKWKENKNFCKGEPEKNNVFVCDFDPHLWTGHLKQDQLILESQQKAWTQMPFRDILLSSSAIKSPVLRPLM